ncbi:MAG: radical SAM protein, partial [Synergistaceae bacterium]|nr:radical SAM protein [Synergistaceae bacterium]
MQLSKYTMMFPLVSPEDTQTGEYALINGLYGAVDIVSPQEFALISDAMHTPSLLQELPKSRLETLTDRGHIVSNEAQESEDLRIISRIHTLLYGRGGIGLVLAPTYNCNLRCSYCYERHRLARGLDWLERTMSDSLLESIFAQLKDYKSRGYSVRHCTLYGGEPLLARNKPLIRKICEHCRQMDMSVSAVTNGCDLDQFIDLIDEYKISSIQVTVDGVGDVHDRRRPFAEGRGSYS